ncbi:hypothetical protein BDZ94DRAFT_1319067 [Collybia nuda]|uniref:Prolyl 4-hydroxylase alpha subunit Fe(2+) 2OG dioxygenase domain-containing protein n=1 Tax=Collybia nuda TaxID=64659 RepID=A0A9P6CI39_9AGAR|nr:hypothetical protein BDZ94DRAFT_1319067 [Collybia nuda]
MTITTSIAPLKASIMRKPPFCTGTIPLLPGNAVVFYKRGLQSNCVDLSRATENDLDSLVQACVPATVGVDQCDVLDESYRKAGKIDFADFAAKFDVDQGGIVDRIRAQLLAGLDESKPIRTELSKLNVYGKGSFFKAHKDTPRSDKMFGTLVVVYPTPHEGGTLLMRHSGQEWSFDSAEAVQQHEQGHPVVAYAAFYSDVEHEVTEIQSGHRVTLTYNLYFESKNRPPLSPAITPIAPDDRVFERALMTALEDPQFLPKGGILGFGLTFMYPVSPETTTLNKLVSRLKGSDAVIKRVCDHLSLNVSLKAIYQDCDTSEYSQSVMVDEIRDIEDWRVDKDVATVLRGSYFGGKIIHDFGTPPPKDWNGEPVVGAVEILWVTPLTPHAHFKSPYIAYGNEAAFACIYGDVCLVAQVGPVGRRATKEGLKTKNSGLAY